MFKNKLFNFVVFTSLLFGLAFVSSAKADTTDTTLPDNVKITTSPDGSSTTVIINSKPGFTTNVSTSCVNGKCTNTATSKALTTADIQKMQDNMKKEQQAMEAFWKQQDDFFAAQQKMFDDLWGTNTF